MNGVKHGVRGELISNLKIIIDYIPEKSVDIMKLLVLPQILYVKYLRKASSFLAPW